MKLEELVIAAALNGLTLKPTVSQNELGTITIETSDGASYDFPVNIGMNGDSIRFEES